MYFTHFSRVRCTCCEWIGSFYDAVQTVVDEEDEEVLCCDNFCPECGEEIEFLPKEGAIQYAPEIWCSE